jgi:hypothetical protein
MKYGFCVLALSIVLTGCQNPAPVDSVDASDPLTGWFQVVNAQSGNRSPGPIIPVFKIDGAYFSVCRGVEIPLKRSVEGLQWALEASSMAGTTIGIRGGEPFIIIRDAQSENFTSELPNPHNTGPRPMKRIDRPAGLLKLAAPAPKSNEDFVGCYRPVYFPYANIEIRSEGGQFFFAEQEIGQAAYSEPKVLTPLPDRLGFTCLDRDCRNMLTYNESLKRFELVMTRATPPLRMPLARISTQARGENIVTEADVPPNFAPIGIPTWH